MQTFSLKAPGDDTIQNIALKNISRKALVQIAYIINAIIRVGHFPQCWKTSIVLRILKPGKNPEKPASYRPISLLPSLNKITEKIILNRIKKHEKQQKQIIDEPFGFREKHNTVQQVVRIVNDIRRNYNNNKVTVMALLDIEKAFDRVWIDGLIYKMFSGAYPIIIIILIYSYLSNRTLRVNNTKSLPRSIKAPAGIRSWTTIIQHLYQRYNQISKDEPRPLRRRHGNICSFLQCNGHCETSSNTCRLTTALLRQMEDYA